MKPYSIPTSPELIKDPELAILSALDATIAITWQAIMACYPDLYNDRRIYDNPPPPMTLFMARHIVQKIDQLHDALTGYRQRVKELREAANKNLPLGYPKS